MRQQCESTFFHFFPDTMRHAFDWLSFLTRKYFGSCSASRLFHSTKSCHQTNWAWCETSNCSTGFDRREKTMTATVACALIKNLCGVSKRMGGGGKTLCCSVLDKQEMTGLSVFFFQMFSFFFDNCKVTDCTVLAYRLTIGRYHITPAVYTPKIY